MLLHISTTQRLWSFLLLFVCVQKTVPYFVFWQYYQGVMIMPTTVWSVLQFRRRFSVQLVLLTSLVSWCPHCVQNAIHIQIAIDASYRPNDDSSKDKSRELNSLSRGSIVFWVKCIHYHGFPIVTLIVWKLIHSVAFFLEICSQCTQIQAMIKMLNSLFLWYENNREFGWPGSSVLSPLLFGHGCWCFGKFLVHLSVHWPGKIHKRKRKSWLVIRG